jgi:hypothetical protein
MTVVISLNLGARSQACQPEEVIMAERFLKNDGATAHGAFSLIPDKR